MRAPLKSRFNECKAESHPQCVTASIYSSQLNTNTQNLKQIMIIHCNSYCFNIVALVPFPFTVSGLKCCKIPARYKEHVVHLLQPQSFGEQGLLYVCCVDYQAVHTSLSSFKAFVQLLFCTSFFPFRSSFRIENLVLYAVHTVDDICI